MGAGRHDNSANSTANSLKYMPDLLSMSGLPTHHPHHHPQQQPHHHQQQSPSVSPIHHPHHLQHLGRHRLGHANNDSLVEMEDDEDEEDLLSSSSAGGQDKNNPPQKKKKRRVLFSKVSHELSWSCLAVLSEEAFLGRPLYSLSNCLTLEAKQLIRHEQLDQGCWACQ